jgi:hypothetical protein
LTKGLKKKPSHKHNEHKKVSEVYENVYGDDQLEKLDKRAAKAKRLAATEPAMKKGSKKDLLKELKPKKESKKESKKHHKEDPEMPLDMHSEMSKTAVLDADVPVELAPAHKKHSHQAEGKKSFMSADDTDTDKDQANKKNSLVHKGKGVEMHEVREFDKKMQKKDKASDAMKKEFKKQMDLTKNIDQEEEPKAPKASIKVEAKKEAKKAPKQETPKKEEAAKE